MKRAIKKWVTRLSATVFLIIILLITIILNPSLLYANKTTYLNFTIFHGGKIESPLHVYLDEVSIILKQSELYDSSFSFELCLNDGSRYPAIIKRMQGEAFGWGFYNKVVLSGKTDYANNSVLLNGRKWNFTQLVAHEATHCLQFQRYGFWKSKPLANIPNWKWEGYPEYVARQSNNKKSLDQNISWLLEIEKTNKDGWVDFEDGTGCSLQYFKDLLVVRFCVEVKQMNYDSLLRDKNSREYFWKEMMNLYTQKRN